MRCSISKRVVAFVLALAMVFSYGFSSETSVNAASKAKLKSIVVKVAGKKVTAKTTTTITQGKTAKIAVTSKPAKAKKTITYKSSNKKIATVSKKGVIKGVKAGNAKITVTVKSKNTKKLTFKVKVAAKKTTTTTSTVATTTEKMDPDVTAKVGELDTNTGLIAVTYSSAVPNPAQTSVTLTSADKSVSVVAKYSSVSTDGTMVTYKVSASDLNKVSAGNYTVSITGSNATVTTPSISAQAADIAEEGTGVKGMVYTLDDNGSVVPIQDATVNIGGTDATTNRYGVYYQAKTASTIKDIKVKAAGYFDETISTVKVTSNTCSAYNFEMEKYDVDQIFLYGTLSASDGTKIKDAYVDLYEDGKLKATAVSDSNGNYVFANSNALSNVKAVNNFEISTSSDAYVQFEKDVDNDVNENIDSTHSYTIKISKPLSSDNLYDVIADDEQAVAISSARGNCIDFASVVQIKKSEGIKATITWDAKSVANTSGKVNVTLVDTDGEYALASDKVAVTVEDSQAIIKLNEQILFTAMPTLPSGTYYMLIQDLDAKGNAQNAITVIPVDITEGEAKAVSGTIVPAVSESFTFNSQNTSTDSLKNQGTGDLCIVTDSKGTVSKSTPVSLYAKVYTTVGSKKVLISVESISSFTKSSEVYTGNDKMSILAANTTYTLDVIPGYFEEKTETFTSPADSTTLASKSVDVNACANVTVVKMDSGSLKDNGEDVSGSTTVKVNSVSLIDNTGKVAGTAEIGAKYTYSNLMSSGVSITDGSLSGIAPGKYTVSWDIDGYVSNPGKDNVNADDPDTLISFEKATVLSNGQYKKIHSTIINGTVSLAEGSTTTLSASGLVIIYNSDKTKIVAASNLYKDGDTIKYEIENGIDGEFEAGNYVAVIRANNIDTQEKSFTVKANEVNTVDFTKLSVGATAKIVSPIKNSVTKTPIEALFSYVYAYDKYYIDPYDTEKVNEDAAWYLKNYSSYAGVYSVRQTDESTWTATGLSATTYTVRMSGYYLETTDAEVSLTNGQTYSEVLYATPKVFSDYKIELTVTNKNSSFTSGSVDFVEVTDSNGKVVARQNYIRSKSIETLSPYVYVPEAGTYTIYYYSNDGQAYHYEKTVQKTETVSMDIIVSTIE